MSIAKILAPLNGTPRDEIVLATAFSAAIPFESHVVALFVHPDPKLVVPFVGAPVAADVLQDIVDTAEEIAKSGAAKARTALAAAANKNGVALLETPQKIKGASCSFREVQGLYFRAVAQAAETCDLVVFGTISGPDTVELSEGFVEILTRAARPILLSAEATAQLGRKIVVGWDGGASAARAVTAALPFLKKAESIEILNVRRSRGPEPEFADLREYLMLHGLSANERTVDQGSRRIGEALLDGATQAGAAMLVMGAYSHGPLRESVFGGATAHIRSHATLPIFLAH
jgi:nucleotide-binding universal stress UspA family protein